MMIDCRMQRLEAEARAAEQQRRYSWWTDVATGWHRWLWQRPMQSFVVMWIVWPATNFATLRSPIVCSLLVVAFGRRLVAYCVM